MLLKKYTNKYGYERVDCPFCGYDSKVRKTKEDYPDPFRSLKTHISNEAKKEALEYFFLGDMAKIDHLRYYADHTSHKEVKISPKRVFDNDMNFE